jgi:hypothetical protein
MLPVDNSRTRLDGARPSHIGDHMNGLDRECQPGDLLICHDDIGNYKYLGFVDGIPTPSGCCVDIQTGMPVIVISAIGPLMSSDIWYVYAITTETITWFPPYSVEIQEV